MYRILILGLWSSLGLIVVLLLGGCPSMPVVEEEPESPVSSSPPPVVDTTTYHIVQRGETLYGIASRYGRNYKDVAQWNGIPSPYALNPGQRLRLDGAPRGGDYSSVPAISPTPVPPAISDPRPGIPVVTTPPPIPRPIPTSPELEPHKDEPEQKQQHIVQKGETLYGIATRYGLSFGDLAKWNGVEVPYNLSIGQTLVLSKPKGWTPSPQSSPALEPNLKPTEPAAPPQEKRRDYHIVQPGDTLYRLAKHYGFGLNELALWNGLESPYSLSVGQKLRISAPKGDYVIPQPVSRPMTPKKSGDYHIVAAGETLFAISRLYGRTTLELAEWNQLEPPYTLSLGQRLRVTPPNESSSLESSPYKRVSLPSRPKSSYHIVKKGETLSSIARKYGLALSDLAEWNGIGSPYTVYPGLRLTIVSP